MKRGGRETAVRGKYWYKSACDLHKVLEGKITRIDGRAWQVKYDVTCIKQWAV